MILRNGKTEEGLKKGINELLIKNRDWLYQKAIVENLKDYEIAKITGYAEATIANYRFKYGILRKKGILKHRFIEYQPTNLLNYNETKKAAIAGFCDGDGCISIVKVKKRRSSNFSYYGAVIFAQNRNDKIKILRSIQYHFGGVIMGTKRTRLKTKSAQLRIGFWQSYNLICECYEYLIVRYKQALTFLELFEEKINKPLTRETIEQKEWLERMEKIKKKNNWYNRKGTYASRKYTKEKTMQKDLF